MTISFPEYKKTLEEAIKSDTSGHFQRLLISLAQVRACWDFGICLSCVCRWCGFFLVWLWLVFGFFILILKKAVHQSPSVTLLDLLILSGKQR